MDAAALILFTLMLLALKISFREIKTAIQAIALLLVLNHISNQIIKKLKQK